MDFNNTTTLIGLIQECERITNLGDGGISGNATRLKEFTARINNAYDRFYSLAFQYDTNWNIDDTNWGSDPVATTNYLEGINEYALTLFDSEVLVVSQVFGKDSTGVYQELKLQDDKENPIIYRATGTTGKPKTFKMIGNKIFVDPIPDANTSDGLKVVFKRNGEKFASTDTTKDPGIPSLFHPYLAREASLHYLVQKRIPNVQAVSNLVARDEEDIKTFFSNRVKPNGIGLRVTQEDNR